MSCHRTTLLDHLCAGRSERVTAELIEVLMTLAGAIREISEHVDRAPLAAPSPGASTAAGTGPVGPVPPGDTNVHGEVQQPLDLISNDIVIRALSCSENVAALASEELPDVLPTSCPSGSLAGPAPYVVAFDPLDGSSNLETNVGVGTIFSVLPNPDRNHDPLDGQPSEPAFLQPGTAQVAAGFALYGPSTVLVLTVGSGVDAFTLDRTTGEFLLTHSQLMIPAATREYAINSSNERFWEPPVRRYVQECLAGRPGPRGRDFNTRWIASLVAESFRILTRGGVFLYPRDSKDPGREGRLRSLYECHPISFIVEQAGGWASTGRERTLSRRPRDLHERAPFVFGSREEVERVERYHLTSAPPFDRSLFNDRSLFRVS